MSVQQRLMFLVQRHLIDEDIMTITLNIRNQLGKKWQVNLETKQVEMLLIHLAMALGRIKRGYVAQALNADFFAEIERAVCFTKVLALHQELLDFIPFPIPEAEQSHFIANIYSLSLAQPWILTNK
ncbi:hypothetical protein B0186_02110 [Canicola haemoglobinophilus]|uniref:PRD domain n=1 Tax=Canicola haemoglobinophilus TaxID=733 RepID=A0A1V4B360_9PAST|nr:hypothetical protein B0186_02110 [Canicola haemoglobinophilus]STO55406.1 PRD domain [Canicola haemoglobinophilus]STO59109.1 PRD domain [Canicola haemoglobinophilus]STO67734.1 PRD domain [Canicola haemoglobinophilus]